jgi:hypothetical protein
MWFMHESMMDKTMPGSESDVVSMICRDGTQRFSVGRFDSPIQIVNLAKP